MESFSQRWCRVLERALVELWTQVLTGSQTTRIFVEFRLLASGSALSCLTLVLFLCPLSATKPETTWTFSCHSHGIKGKSRRVILNAF